MHIDFLIHSAPASALFFWRRCHHTVQVHARTAGELQAILTDLHALAKLTPTSQASIQQLPFGGAATAVASAASAAAAAAAASPPAQTPASTATQAAANASNANHSNAAAASTATGTTHTPSATGSASTGSAGGSNLRARTAKRVLILGSGYVAAPVVEYLTRAGLAVPNEVTVASLELEAAQRLCAGNAAARPMFLNAQVRWLNR
jgi:hypothetical protein